MITFLPDDVSPCFCLTKPALKALLRFVSEDATRISLAQVLFCPVTGQVWATTGHVAMAWRATPGAVVSVAAAESWVVTRALLDRAAKLVPTKGLVRVTREAVRVVLGVGAGEVAEPVPDQREAPAFPNMDQVFPKALAAHPPAYWGVNAHLLALTAHLPALVGRANSFMRMDAPDNELAPMVFRCGDGEATAALVVMPVRLVP